MSSIDQRDYSTIQLIIKFKQLTASQLHTLNYYPSTIRSTHRSLDKLKVAKFITPLTDKLVGNGGNPRYIWVLDTNGLSLAPEGYRRQTSIRHHTLEIAQTFTGVVELAHAGQLRVVNYLTEPENHERIGQNRIDPDLFIEVELPGGQLRHIWLEADLGATRYSSESDKHIRDKLRRYVEASQDTGSYWPAYLLQHAADGSPLYEQIEVGGQVVNVQRRWFPRVVFLVQNEWRLRVIQRLISQLPVDDQALFRVVERSDIAGMFS